jgi:hypothetical protein
MSRRLFIIGIAVLAVFGTGTNVQAEYIPVYRMIGSLEPYISKEGYACPYLTLKDIVLDHDKKLPIILNYSSEQRVASPEFGEGWFCPLFQSRVSDYNDHIKQFITLGGKVLYLVPDKRNGGWKEYYTNNWTGVEKGSIFELRHANGTKFTYVKGLISEVTAPDGRVIKWIRNGNQVIELREQGKRALLKVSYDGSGIAKQLMVNPDDRSKTIYAIEPDYVAGGIKKISSQTGWQVGFNKSWDDKQNPIFTIASNNRPPLVLKWDVKTGTILSDSLWNYKINPSKGVGDWPPINRASKNGKITESYKVDGVTGVTTKLLFNGVTQKTYQVATPRSEVYKHVRMIEEVGKDGKKRVVMRKAYDDNDRVTFMAMTLNNGKEATKRFIYDQSGRMVSYIFNDKVQWKDVYNEKNGQLLSRELPQLGVRTDFSHGLNGEVKAVTIDRSKRAEEKFYSADEWNKQLVLRQVHTS